MERFGRRRIPVTEPDDSSGAPAIRDASAILARAREDEAAADLARETYRSQPMSVLEPDVRIAPMLGPDEQVLAVRRSSALDRRQPIAGRETPRLAGDLYLTSRRLVLVGRVAVAFELRDIEEVGLSGERLLLALSDGQGVLLDVDQPRLLRVEVATARAFART